MAVFFRVEDEAGWGMYSCIDRGRCVMPDEADLRRPSPWCVFADRMDKGLTGFDVPWCDDKTRYGFKHLGQAAEWIAQPYLLDALVAAGFRIGVYVVDSHTAYQVGYKQVRFDVSQAHTRGHLSLETIRQAVLLEAYDE